MSNRTTREELTMTESLVNSENTSKLENNEESLGSPSSSDKRRNYRQLYKKDWEENPLFKGWLSGVPGDKYKAICRVCNKKLLAHRLTILKHASSAKHLNKLDVMKKCNLNVDNQVDQSSLTNNSPPNFELEKVPVASFSGGDKVTNPLDPTSEKEFSSNMVLTHPDTEGLYVNAIPVTAVSQELIEKTLQNASVPTESVPDNLNLFLQTETYVDISDSSEAINFKPGYVAKNSKNNLLSTFLNAKLEESVNDDVISKITTIPLQVSTRVTDYSRGVSVNNLSITLYKLSSGKWMSVSESMTDEVGRCNFFPKSDTYFSIGCYKLHYDVATYYELQNLKSYFPFIEISFLLRSPNESHHIPLMISPNGYTAYRSLDF